MNLTDSLSSYSNVPWW